MTTNQSSGAIPEDASRLLASPQSTARPTGIGLALLAALLFGVSAPLAKLLLRHTDPQLLAGLLYLGSGTGLAIVFLARRGRIAVEAPLSRADMPWLGGAILSGGVVGPLLLMLGLAHTPASSASLLLNLEGVFTAALAWSLFHENVDRRIALGMVAIIIGSAVLSWQGRAELRSVIGPLAIVGACAAWALDNNLTQKVSASDPVQIAMLKGLIAGLTNLAIAKAVGSAWPDKATIAAAGWLGFASYGLSLVFFIFALRRLGTARTGAYFSTAPFVGAIVSLLVWREPLTVGLLIGAACMAVGVWLHVSERHAHAHLHEELVHTHAHVHDAHHEHRHESGDPPVTDPRPHSHPHRHVPLAHTHAHYPDIHHRHIHGSHSSSLGE